MTDVQRSLHDELVEYKIPPVIREIADHDITLSTSLSVVMALFTAVNTLIIQILVNRTEDDAKWRALRSIAYIGLLFNASGTVAAIFVINSATGLNRRVRDYIIDTQEDPPLLSKTIHDTQQIPQRLLLVKNEGKLKQEYGMTHHYKFQVYYMLVAFVLGFIFFLTTVALWVWCTEHRSVSIVVSIVLFFVGSTLVRILRLPDRLLRKGVRKATAWYQKGK